MGSIDSKSRFDFLQSNRVSLIDTKTTETIKELKTDAMPEGLTVLGSCVIVAATEARHLNLFNINSDSVTPFATIDYTDQGDRLRSVRALASDPSLPGMTIYLRSVFPWSGGDKKIESSMYRVDVHKPEILKTCGRH